MKSKLKARLPGLGRLPRPAHWPAWVRLLIIRELVVLVCALAIGVGYSCAISPQYLPTLSGNVYAMFPGQDSLFMVLSKNANNSLVHVDNQGRLLNYVTTHTNQAFQDLLVQDDTIYAILATYEDGATTQALVSLTLDKGSMRIRHLENLSRLDAAPNAGITWTGLYFPLGEDRPDAVRLGGIDQEGQGYILYWYMETGRTRLERVLEGEQLYLLKYVDDGHYVWVNRSRQAGQFIQGVWQRDLLSGLAQTPHHISTYEDRCFLSDSITGSIYELLPDGSAPLYRAGDGAIGSTGYTYRQLEIFTTYPDSAGDIRIVGLCASDNGTSSVVAGEDRSITRLDMGLLGPLLVLEHAWHIFLISWLALIVVVELIRAILRSSRLVVRLSLCELVIAGALLASVTWIQYGSFQATLQEAALQKLTLAGGNLSVLLSATEDITDEEVEMAVRELNQRLIGATAGAGSYDIDVIWADESGPKTGYNHNIPPGYLVEDVRSRGYYQLVSQELKRGKSGLQQIQNDVNTEYVFVQCFFMGSRAGCVTVAQAEEDIMGGRATFWFGMYPIFVAGPLLFLLLVFFTWYLLRPMGALHESLREFYECGGGNQMDLSRFPRTELYRVGQVFNELSVQTRVQFNALATINSSYVRLVSGCLLQMLNKKDVLELSAGEYTAVDGALLTIVPGSPMRTAEGLERLAAPAAGHIQAHAGMIIDYDEGMGAFTALFGRADQALSCARACLAGYDGRDQAVMAAVFTETVEVGVFGSEKLLYPVAVSSALHRRQKVLALLSTFHAVLVRSGNVDCGALRLLGWDNGADYYEDPASRPGTWQTRWKEAAPIWREAMKHFQQEQFVEAMREFARVLRLMPDDNAARWYLFRCESLRDGRTDKPDTGLLFDWRGNYG